MEIQERISATPKAGRIKPRCGASRKYDGRPCEAPALPNGRCKLHGGLSTGPRTLVGQIRSLAGLWQYEKCRKEILGVAAAIESGRNEKEAFDRLITNASPYAESAARKIVAWMVIAP